jgi:hypothetical protein
MKLERREREGVKRLRTTTMRTGGIRGRRRREEKGGECGGAFLEKCSPYEKRTHLWPAQVN